MNDLTKLFWNEHFRDTDRVKLFGIKAKIYDWLNRDNFGGFGINGKRVWFERTWSGANFPNYIYNYLRKWCKEQGYSTLQ